MLDDAVTCSPFRAACHVFSRSVALLVAFGVHCALSLTTRLTNARAKELVLGACFPKRRKDAALTCRFPRAKGSKWLCTVLDRCAYQRFAAVSHPRTSCLEGQHLDPGATVHTAWERMAPICYIHQVCTEHGSPLFCWKKNWRKFTLLEAAKEAKK